jgi:hypothetical protein
MENDLEADRQAPMLPLPYTRLIHEKLSIILTFAFSLPRLRRILQSHFAGSWPNLQKTVNEIGSERALQAFIDVAVYLRLLDDREDHSGALARMSKLFGDDEKQITFGLVLSAGQPDQPLYLRDLTNKVIHASDWKWDVGDGDRPKLVCISNDPDRWTKAEVDIVAFAAFCGLLAH